MTTSGRDYAGEVMRYVAPGLYPAIRGSTPRARTKKVAQLGERLDKEMD